MGIWIGIKNIKRFCVEEGQKWIWMIEMLLELFSWKRLISKSWGSKPISESFEVKYAHQWEIPSNQNLAKKGKNLIRKTYSPTFLIEICSKKKQNEKQNHATTTKNRIQFNKNRMRCSGMVVCVSVRALNTLCAMWVRFYRALHSHNIATTIEWRVYVCSVKAHKQSVSYWIEHSFCCVTWYVICEKIAFWQPLAVCCRTGKHVSVLLRNEWTFIHIWWFCGGLYRWHLHQ